MTGRYSRQKGRRFELQVAHYLDTVTTASTRAGVHDDGGDVVLDGWVIECKDHQRWAVPSWWRALVAKVRPGERPALVLKWPGVADPAEALVVMRLEDWDQMRKGQQ